LTLPPAEERGPEVENVIEAELQTDAVKSEAHAPSKIRIRFGGFVALAVVLTWLCIAISNPQHHIFNWYLSVIWSTYFPISIVGLIGALHMRKRNGGYIERSEFRDSVDERIIFVIPSLCRADTTNALRRVVMSILNGAPTNFPNFRIDVVTEEGLAAPELVKWLASLPSVRVVMVPKAYETPKGAKYKTRANQYAMELRQREGDNTADSYVYHIDDDTSVGADTVASLAEFIATCRDGRYYLAQGVLAFPRELTSSTLCWLADSVRPGDDITRFSFFTVMLGRPLGGLHGEHLVVRADIEESIGWDFPNTVIEDAYFALEFAERYPGKSTVLNSLCYGASPSSVADFVRQRRRWVEGLLRLTFKSSHRRRSRACFGYSVMCWALAPFQFVGFVVFVAWAMGTNNTSPDFTWISGIWCFGLAFLMWQYMQGLKVNIAASDRKITYWWRALLMIPGIWVFATLESLGCLLGMIRFCGIGRQKESEVIAKPI
jgi:egghead protein (zeste-white 4 protein)